MIREIKIDLTYQPTIEKPPLNDLHERACSGDQLTIKHWKDTWLKNLRENKKRFGQFSDHSYGKLFGWNRHKAAIVAGSGPSLKYCINELKENQKHPGKVPLVSCLHNFGYFEDNGIYPDYYFTLDSGKIVLADVSESRDHDADWYWERSKDKTLIAYAGSDPELFEKWQGKVYLFACMVPDLGVMKQFGEIERFPHYISTGGNATGGSMYFAKVLGQSTTIIYIGLDCCFSYENTWHSYGTDTYDKLGQYVLAVDCFGNMRKTWPSYQNFAHWFTHIAMTVPGEWIMCSEGIVGAYRDGNVKYFKFMSLKEALTRWYMTEQIYLCKAGPDGNEVGRDCIDLKGVYSDPKYPIDLAAF